MLCFQQGSALSCTFAGATSTQLGTHVCTSCAPAQSLTLIAQNQSPAVTAACVSLAIPFHIVCQPSVYEAPCYEATSRLPQFVFSCYHLHPLLRAPLSPRR
jgi:hypothetical protein